MISISILLFKEGEQNAVPKIYTCENPKINEELYFNYYGVRGPDKLGPNDKPEIVNLLELNTRLDNNHYCFLDINYFYLSNETMDKANEEILSLVYWIDYLKASVNNFTKIGVFIPNLPMNFNKDLVSFNSVKYLIRYLNNNVDIYIRTFNSELKKQLNLRVIDSRLTSFQKDIIQHLKLNEVKRDNLILLDEGSRTIKAENLIPNTYNTEIFRNMLIQHSLLKEADREYLEKHNRIYVFEDISDDNMEAKAVISEFNNANILSLRDKLDNIYILAATANTASQTFKDLMTMNENKVITLICAIHGY